MNTAESSTQKLQEQRVQVASSIIDRLIKAKVLKEPTHIDWLPQDASNRFYGRIAAIKSVVMVLNAPEAFRSEEVTTKSEIKIGELPFVSIGRDWAQSRVRVPAISWVDPQSEFLVCEDFGDRLLYLERQDSPAIEWYERAMEELVRIQGTSNALVSSRSFTHELLTWEFEHFVEYAIQKRHRKISAGDLHQLRQFGESLVQAMLSAPQVPTHRDYHSKNLMVLRDERRLGVIDFQDALTGPETYDLASLLRDSYVRLTPEEEEHCLRNFEFLAKRSIDRRVFYQTSLQRNLKAIGRFYYISMVKGRDTHLPFIAPSLKRVLATLEQMQEKRMREWFAAFFAAEMLS